ncbi:MAG: hypothetical protein ABEI57_07700 [Halapricum sp.]
MPPREVFGIPHGILSAAEERIALLIGRGALVAAVLDDGKLDRRR